MKINSDNYEGFLLDMAEGRLSAGQEKELYKFLDENSHLEADPGILNYRIPLEDNTFPLKENMKKGDSIREINKDNYEQFCIARLEGDLSLSGERKLDEFLERNPGLIRNASIYNTLVLKADDSVVFFGKPDLKKSPGRRKFLHRRAIYLSVSIAATFAVLVSSYFFLQDSTKSGQTDINPPPDAISSHHEIIPSLNDIKKIRARAGVIPNDLLSSETGEKGTLIKSENENNIIIRENVNSNELKQGSSLARAASLPYAKTSAFGNLKVESSKPSGNSEMIHFVALPVKTPGSPYRPDQDGRSVTGNLISFLSLAVNADQERPRAILWDVAHAGVRGINAIAGTDIRLDRETDDDGEVVFMAFSAGFIEIQRSGSLIDE